MAALPSEVWTQIFQNLSVVDEVASASPETWAKIVTSNKIHTDIGSPDPALQENYVTKRALGLVSRPFYELSRPFALECITLRTVDSVQYLARMLNEKPQLATIVSCYTRRIDILIPSGISSISPSFLDNKSSSGPGTQHNLKDIHDILKSCPNLTYLFCRIHEELLHAVNGIISVLLDACPCLEVLRWQFLSITSTELCTVLPNFSNLRVLDLTKIDGKELVMRKAYELPHLHTLIGRLDVICPQFHDIILPSFHTLVCTPSDRMTFDMSQSRFFRRHGDKIKSLDLDDNSCRFLGFEFLCRNVTELILNTFWLGPFELRWPKLKSLGLVDRINIGNTDFLIYLLDVLESLKQRGCCPEVKTVRILQEETVRVLRERNLAGIQGCEQRLRRLSISLEDNTGKPFTPSSS